MSQYTNKNELFLEPKTNQYGSHMIMSNVIKPPKTKFLNIDTRFRDEYNYLQVANYNITLPQRITDVKTVGIRSIEIPMSFYNISTSLGNNYFLITDVSNGLTKTVTIPDGNYNAASIRNAINYGLTGTDLSFNYSGSNSVFTTASGDTMTINFDVTSTGTSDKYSIKSKLGWILGFRNLSYTLPQRSSITSESVIDLNGPRYLYLALDEFNKGNQYSFVSPLYTSIINKNIIARITMNPAVYGYGTILPANLTNGYLVSDFRSYTGKIDLLKLNVQLLDENGNPVNFNGLDFSFCLEIEHE